MVDIQALETATHQATLAEIKAEPKLEEMILVNNSRLSVQPVLASEWKFVCKICGLDPKRTKANVAENAKP
jgi:predicted RNA-binding protein with PUA-like domain